MSNTVTTDQIRKVMSELGKRSAESLTPAQKTARGKKGAATRWARRKKAKK